MLPSRQIQDTTAPNESSPGRYAAFLLAEQQAANSRPNVRNLHPAESKPAFAHSPSWLARSHPPENIRPRYHRSSEQVLGASLSSAQMSSATQALRQPAQRT